MSLWVEDWLPVECIFVDSDRLNSFGHLTTVSGLLVTLTSDWMKLLFVGLSGFCSNFPVLDPNDVVWIIKNSD